MPARTQTSPVALATYQAAGHLRSAGQPIGTVPLGPAKSDDGRLRFNRSTREQVYRYLIECIRCERPDLEIGLCLEDELMFASLDLRESIGQCNCVL